MQKCPTGYQDDGAWCVRVNGEVISVFCKLCGETQNAIIGSQKEIIFTCCSKLTYSFFIT